jgi:hypothetical protein
VALQRIFRPHNRPSCHSSVSHHAGDWSYGSWGPGGAGSRLLNQVTGTKQQEQEKNNMGGGGHHSQPIASIMVENLHARLLMPELIVPQALSGRSWAHRWRGIGWRFLWGGAPTNEGNDGASTRTGRLSRAIGGLRNHQNPMSLKWPGFDDFCMLDNHG